MPAPRKNEYELLDLNMKWGDEMLQRGDMLNLTEAQAAEIESMANRQRLRRVYHEDR